MPPAARITDIVTCPVGTGPIIPPCAPTVITAFMPQARMSDQAICSMGGLDAIVMGSPTVIVMNMMAARIGDPTVHLGVVTTGAPTVMIGEVGTPSPIDPDTGMGRIAAAMGESGKITPQTGTPQQRALQDAAAEGTATVEKCPYAHH